MFYALGIVLTQAFNGADDTWTPTWINFGCFWLWEIPLAYVLGRVVGLGPFGVFLAVTMAYSMLGVVSAVLLPAGSLERAPRVRRLGAQRRRTGVGRPGEVARPGGATTRPPTVLEL
ncbi:MAG TPA: hypothetical protein VM736_09395 [Gemmatimonadales bacterium]|nr:hypothetical protein [Gemmatimonadales bacterium]